MSDVRYNLSRALPSINAADSYHSRVESMLNDITLGVSGLYPGMHYLVM
jgi:hypothetical protein